MMLKSKGEQTREMIIQEAAVVFNCQGYFGASLADIMRVTGLEKGGIYNHFESKEELALAAFDYAVELVTEAFREALKGKRHAVDRLLAIVGVFADMPDDFPLPGGCPVINTAVEADDAHPVLREKARQAMNEWHNFIHRVVNRGLERKEVRLESDPDTLATLIIATLEGAVMLSRLYENKIYMKRMVAYLTHYLETSVRATAA